MDLVVHVVCQVVLVVPGFAITNYTAASAAVIVVNSVGGGSGVLLLIDYGRVRAACSNFNFWIVKRIWFKHRCTCLSSL